MAIRPMLTGAIYLSMEAQGFVWVVSLKWAFLYEVICITILTAAPMRIEDFALIEASYTIVRMLQKYSVIKSSENQVYEKVGFEQQKMTLVMAAANGCVLQFRWHKIYSKANIPRGIEMTNAPLTKLNSDLGNSRYVEWLQEGELGGELHGELGGKVELDGPFPCHDP
jgi:hypothetical protein